MQDSGPIMDDDEGTVGSGFSERTAAKEILKTAAWGVGNIGFSHVLGIIVKKVMNGFQGNGDPTNDLPLSQPPTTPSAAADHLSSEVATELVQEAASELVIQSTVDATVSSSASATSSSFGLVVGGGGGVPPVATPMTGAE